MNQKNLLVRPISFAAAAVLLGFITNCSQPVSFKTGGLAQSSSTGANSASSTSTVSNTSSTDGNTGVSSGGSSTVSTSVPAACTTSNTHIVSGATLPLGVTPTMLAAICPAVGSNSDCTAVIIVSDSGVYLYFNPNQPSSDDGANFGNGFDDTIIGVLNISNSTTIKTLGLNSNSDIFGFDGDGIDTYIGHTNVTNGTTNFSTNPMDTTGYGGPNAYFSFQKGCTFDSTRSGYVSSSNYPAACNGGVVNFINPVAPGESTFFGLENALSSASACLSTQVN